MTEALRTREGDIAPTLGALLRAGRYDERVRAAFEKFATDFDASDVVIGDFSADNIVLAWDAELGERFVLVDGLGCSTFIPLKAWCRLANRWSKRRQLARVRAQLPELYGAAAIPASPRSWWKKAVRQRRAPSRPAFELPADRGALAGD